MINRRLLPMFAICVFATITAGCSKKTEETPVAGGPATETVARTAQSAPTKEEDEPLGSGDAVALAETYAQQCGSGASSKDCEILRDLLVVEVASALEQIERSRDQRGTEEALAALDLTEEPELLVAACRILGQFPDTPGIAEKALPLILTSPYVEVQDAAADLVARNSDVNIADVGRLWGQNHSGIGAQNAYTQYPDFPKHYESMRFPAYPGAAWFSPGDSQQSIGWSTADDAATVAAWIGKALNATPLTTQQWYERQSAQTQQAFQSLDQTKVDRIAKLSEQYAKTLDPALIEQVEKLQKELYAPFEAAKSVADTSMDKVAIAGNSSPPQDVHYFVAEEKAGHIARAVLVFRLPGIDRTVVQTSWNLADYPSAWPENDASP